MATLCSGSSLQNGASQASKNFPWSWKGRAMKNSWNDNGLLVSTSISRFLFLLLTVSIWTLSKSKIPWNQREMKKPMATLCSGSSLQNGASLVSLGSAKNFPWKARRAPLHRWRNGGLYGGWQYIWRRRQRRRQPRNVSRSSSRILRPLASTIRSKMWCTLVASAFQAGRRELQAW